jgi:Xaa-Pro dipeptidase
MNTVTMLINGEAVVASNGATFTRLNALDVSVAIKAPAAIGANQQHHPLYLARRARLQAVMRQMDVPVALIVDPVNILYATGASNMTIFTERTPARYLLVFADGPFILYDFLGCEHLALGLPTVDDIRLALGLCHVSSLGDPEGAARSLAAEIGAQMHEQLGDERRLAVDRLPFQSIDALRAAGLVLRDADPVFARARAIKLPIELPYIREAVRRVQLAAEEMQTLIAPGRSEAEVWADFQRRFLALEGQYIATRLMQGGPRSFPYFQECSARVLDAGDLVCLDTDALGYLGYAVDFSRTFLCGVGRPSAVQKTLYERAREQLECNIALIRPGMTYAEIADRAWPVPPEHQQSRYYAIGHGLGMSGEFPNIPYLKPGQPYPLSGAVEAGMVICIESYIGSADAGQGVKLEEQLLVTETGVERLSTMAFDERLGGG